MRWLLRHLGRTDERPQLPFEVFAVEVFS
jgi:hypothetical protein